MSIYLPAIPWDAAPLHGWEHFGRRNIAIIACWLTLSQRELDESTVMQAVVATNSNLQTHRLFSIIKNSFLSFLVQEDGTLERKFSLDMSDAAAAAYVSELLRDDVRRLHSLVAANPLAATELS